MLVRVEALRQLDMLSAEVGNTTSENLKSIILDLGTYLPPVNSLSKQIRSMRHGTRKTHGLKAIHYNDRMIDLNGYLGVFPRKNTSDNICDTELNEILI